MIGVEEDASQAAVATRLETVLESVAPDLNAWLPLIALAMDVEVSPTPEVEQLDERFHSARLIESVTRLFDAVIVDPHLLIFEDAHWMDERSRDLLAGLVKGVASKPWAVVVTTRTAIPEFASAGSVELCLYPLPSSDAVALARLASRDSLLPQQADVVAQRSGGNPLFVQALVASARGTAELGNLPGSIESAIAARIDELAPPDRTVLRHMAVLGRDIDLTLLADVIQDGQDGQDGASFDLEKTFRRLTGFVRVHDGKATFRQALIRDAAYEGLSYKRRRAIHEKIARLIEQRTPEPESEAELLALHFDKAEQFEDSWRYSRLAVGRAWKRFAPSNVADFSRKTIRAGKRLHKSNGEMAAAWCDLGMGLYRVGLYEEAYSAFAEVRALRGETGLLAWTFLAQGICQEALGKRTFAIRLFTQGLNLLDERTSGSPSEEPSS
ncbi:MAG: ATP-binding protein, partial [Acidimicrobiia bacterium]